MTQPGKGGVWLMKPTPERETERRSREGITRHNRRADPPCRSLRTVSPPSRQPRLIGPHHDPLQPTPAEREIERRSRMASQDTTTGGPKPTLVFPPSLKTTKAHWT